MPENNQFWGISDNEDSLQEDPGNNKIIIIILLILLFGLLSVGVFFWLNKTGRINISAFSHADKEKVKEIQTDTDGDGLTDIEEEIYNTDKTLADTDGDGHSDFVEIKNGYNPHGPGRLNSEEISNNTKEIVAKYKNKFTYELPLIIGKTGQQTLEKSKSFLTPQGLLLILGYVVIYIIVIIFHSISIHLVSKHFFKIVLSKQEVAIKIAFLESLILISYYFIARVVASLILNVFIVSIIYFVGVIIGIVIFLLLFRKFYRTDLKTSLGITLATSLILVVNLIVLKLIIYLLFIFFEQFVEPRSNNDFGNI